MRIKETNEAGVTILECEHCGVGELIAYRPSKPPMLAITVCPKCRKDASGTVVPMVDASELMTQ